MKKLPKDITDNSMISKRLISPNWMMPVLILILSTFFSLLIIFGASSDNSILKIFSLIPLAILFAAIGYSYPSLIVIGSLLFTYSISALITIQIINLGGYDIYLWEIVSLFGYIVLLLNIF